MITRSSSSLTLIRKRFATSLALSATLLTTGCVHRKVVQVLPQVTLSDTRTKRNLAVGQLFFEGTNGKLAAGPNLQSFGLVSHSVSLGPLSVSQPDITLGEFLSAIGASGASCEASLPPQKAPRVSVDWFQKEENILVGEEVSLLLEDVSEQLAEPKSLARLFNEEGHRSTSKTPWALSGSSVYERTVAVVQALYARQAILRFRVSENAKLPLASAYFLGHSAGNVDETILTLIKMASACGVEGHARELPDPGLELAVAFPAPKFMGAGLARYDAGRAKAMTPVETAISLYEVHRLPAYSQESRVPTAEPIWKVDTSTALSFLNQTKDQPRLDGGSTFFKYCPDAGCDAIITSPHEFAGRWQLL